MRVGRDPDDIYFKQFNFCRKLRDVNGDKETSLTLCRGSCVYSLLCLSSGSLTEAVRGHRSLLLKWHFQRNILFICKTERLIFTLPSSQGAVSKETTHVWNLGNAMIWALYHYCVHVRTFWKGRWTSKLLTATWQFRYEVWNMARCLQKPKISLSRTQKYST